MIFSMDVRQARKGDCLLLHFGSKAKPGLALIDGGPKNVYVPHLKPRLDAIRAARRLGEEDALVFDLLMVSHVDDDHIQGLLELTDKEVELKQEQRPRLFNVQSFWHNSFDELIGQPPQELTASVHGHFGLAATDGTGELPPDKEAAVLKDSAEEDIEVVESCLKVLASIEQGFRLRQNAEFLGYDRNPEFDGKLVVARAGGGPISVAQGLKLTVIGPMLPEVRALFKKHQDWLKDLKEKGKSPPEALAAYVDKSVPNLSSIVVLAEAGGKRMLLTGDARGDKVIEGLQLLGLLDPGDDSTMEVDLLKVPHHGSANNLEQNFFERIIAKHYVFSGNGEHGNPEREALEMLIAARGDDDYEVHLTYPIDEIDVERKKDWEKARNKEAARKRTKPDTVVRARWSPARHGLAALLEGNPGFAAKVRTIDEGKAHVIDLADPLGRAWPDLAP